MHFLEFCYVNSALLFSSYLMPLITMGEKFNDRVVVLNYLSVTIFPQNFIKPICFLLTLRHETWNGGNFLNRMRLWPLILLQKRIENWEMHMQKLEL